MNNTNFDLNYQDLDTKRYLNSFGISSPVGLKILKSSKKFKRKLKTEEKEIEKFCSSDVQLISLEDGSLDVILDLVKPFELKIDRLTSCPICKKQLNSSTHSCLTKSNLKKKT